MFPYVLREQYKHIKTDVRSNYNRCNILTNTVIVSNSECYAVEELSIAYTAMDASNININNDIVIVDKTISIL